MAKITTKLNKIFRILVGDNSNTTQTGLDNEYVDSSLMDIMTIDNSRIKKYSDYIHMDDNYGQEISSSLDAVADTTLRRDEPLDIPLGVMSERINTVKFVNDLKRSLDIESKLWSYARSLGKFGDLFVEIIWDKNKRSDKLANIIGLRALPAKTIFLNVEKGKVNMEYPYRQDIDGSEVAKFKPWQIIHFKLIREPTDDYGTSWLKSARLPYRQLVAMENALVISRVKKTNVRVHKVDVTGLTVDQARDAIRTYKEQFKKKLWMNPNTGRIEKHLDPMMGNDDIYVGVTKDAGKYAGLDLMEGKSEVDIKDILYIRDKFMASLKVPKHRLNISDTGVSGSKSVPADQGLYFGASIQRVQLALIDGFSFLFDLGLMVNGVDIKRRKNDYTLSLPKQRTTDELIAARVALINSTVAKNYSEMGLLSNEEIMREILKLDAERIARIKKELEKQGGQDDEKAADSGKDKKDKPATNFNKTGTGSAPVRQPKKEDIDKIIEDEGVAELIKDVKALIKNEKVYGNKKFTDREFLKKQLDKEQKE